MVRIDNQVDEYESSVQTIFEAIGTIGGIYEILKISLGLFVGIYTKKIYQHTVTTNVRPDDSILQPHILDNKVIQNMSEITHKDKRLKSIASFGRTCKNQSDRNIVSQMYNELQNSI